MALKDVYKYINTNLNLSFELSEDIEDGLVFGCQDLIEDMEKDIEKYGKDQMVRLYPDTLGITLVFDSYEIIDENTKTTDYKPYIDLTLGQALNVYKLQDGESINIEN